MYIQFLAISFCEIVGVLQHLEQRSVPQNKKKKLTQIYAIPVLLDCNVYVQVHKISTTFFGVVHC